MPEGTETAVRLHISDRPDALGVVAHPDAELVGTVRREDRLQIDVHDFTVSPDFQLHGFSAGGIDGADQVFLIF